MSNDLAEIKQRIYDEDHIEYLLKELECEYVKDVGERVEAGLPTRYDSRNRRSVQVRKTEKLTSNIRNKGVSGDFYSIVGYLLYGAEDFEQVKEHLFQIKAWVCNALGWDEYLSSRDDFEDKSKKPKKDPLFFLRDVQKKRKARQRKERLGYKENRIINDSVLDRYFDLPHYEFLKDGINIKTQREFGVMFDRESERVVYPLHNKDGDLIGVKGRYVGKSKRIMDEIKYLFLHRCDKSIELYNLFRALPYIEETGEVIVVESAKSCMLGWQWGYKNIVSIEGNEIAPVQAMLLKKLGVQIIFALDKDMDEEFLTKQARQIKSRVCKAIYDKEGLLEGKEAPFDKGKEVWENLYNNHKYLIK